MLLKDVINCPLSQAVHSYLLITHACYKDYRHIYLLLLTYMDCFNPGYIRQCIISEDDICIEIWKLLKKLLSVPCYFIYNLEAAFSEFMKLKLHIVRVILEKKDLNSLLYPGHNFINGCSLIKS